MPEWLSTVVDRRAHRHAPGRAAIGCRDRQFGRSLLRSRPHEVSPGTWEIRAILPDADAVDRAGSRRRTVLGTMERRLPEGYFVGLVQRLRAARLQAADRKAGRSEIRHDPYSFGTFLSHDDLVRIGDPTSDAVYTKLGAHFLDLGGIQGFLFTVWAPNARRVSVVGDFNAGTAGATPCGCATTAGSGSCSFPDVDAGPALQVRDHRRRRQPARR